MEKTLQIEFSKQFKEIRGEVNEFLDNIVGKDLTPIERYNLAQKYNRLNKLTESVTKVLDTTNRLAIKQMNYTLTEIYKRNYNHEFNTLAVLLSLGLPQKSVTSTTANKEIDTTQSPLNDIAVQEVRGTTELSRDIERQFIQGVMNGESTSAIVKRLQKVTEAKLSDIVRIARTQTTRIENLGRQNAYNEIARKLPDGKKLMKVWNCKMLPTSREAHIKMDGAKVPYNKPFIVDGEELMYPGDPNGSPANIINCHCFLTKVIE